MRVGVKIERLIRWLLEVDALQPASDRLFQGSVVRFRTSQANSAKEIIDLQQKRLRRRFGFVKDDIQPCQIDARVAAEFPYHLLGSFFQDGISCSVDFAAL